MASAQKLRKLQNYRLSVEGRADGGRTQAARARPPLTGEGDRPVDGKDADPEGLVQGQGAARKWHESRAGGVSGIGDTRPVAIDSTRGHHLGRRRW